MKKVLFHILLLLISGTIQAQYTVEGGSGTPLQVEVSTANHAVYLLNGLANTELSFTSDKEITHQWYRYNQNTNEAIPSIQSGNRSTITDIDDGWGYYVFSEDTSIRTSYIWIIDYSRYLPQFYSLGIEEEEDKCSLLKIVADVEAEPLFYTVFSEYPYRMALDRTYHLHYSTLKHNEENQSFTEIKVDHQQNGIVAEINIDAPLMDTEFTLIGDDFAKHFGLESTLTTPVYQAVAIEAHYEVTDHKTNGESERKFDGGDIYGDSAPYELSFQAYANEPVAALFRWRIDSIGTYDKARHPIVSGYSNKSFNFTFMEEARYEVILEVTDRSSHCICRPDTTFVQIGSSELKVPNFFTPGTSIGQNDEFRVQYRSITNFRCRIYNRWGNLLYDWDDPTQGWDGRVNGRLVATGAYHYVIEYKDARGNKKSKTGTVNILRDVQQ